MRQLVILLFVGFLVTCRSKDTVQPTPTPGNTVTISTDPTNWPAIKLNTAYTIKFPSGYEGEGAVGFEGLSFGKNRIDKRAAFSYSFCGPLTCNEYGNPLFGGASTSVTYNGQTLDKSITLMQGSQTLGIFYYSVAPKSLGLLYLSEKGQLKESLNVAFDVEVQAEVLAIIKTVRPTL
ncbi:hypothetical protein [Fibrella aquatilis]|uniref:Uncharacterized protein n=1 Tax=Fibrella aquatilis TaxID=2817059 RepID=A0A939JYI1_9BACT|nr:hypothetical protein [Fibrella aquatilis]MBO0930398.1 hypothetical protein [Fibrella aquatilis]